MVKNTKRQASAAGKDSNMQLKEALNAFSFASSMTRDCHTSGEGIGKCDYCNAIDKARLAIMPILESLLGVTGMLSNPGLELKAIRSEDLLDEVAKAEEIKRRLAMLSDTKGDEDVPTQFSQKFEDLVEAIRRHPHVD